MNQATALDKAISDFGAAAKPKLAGPGQPEDQLRNPLETLLHALAAAAGLPTGALTLIGETSLAGLGVRPDFSVYRQGALVGFIEVKAPGKGANPKRFTGHDKAQWDKLKSLPNLLYTDGDSFSLWRNGVIVGEVVQLQGGIETAGAKLRAPAVLLARMEDFLGWNPVPPRDVRDLAATTARLCRYLRDEVAAQLADGNTKLTDLKTDWRALLFPDADDARFADGYAQAVTFGLLMARARGIDLADLPAVATALGQSNTLIGTALRLLTEQDIGLGPSLAIMARVLGVVDWPTIAKGEPEAWLYFYENFLAIYDPKLRKLTGSYYTPPQVVAAMVRLAHEALRAKARFGLNRGLADPAVHLVDPATGSGTYLLEALRSVAATVADADGPGAVPAAVTSTASRMHGFELQFGPYAVAQLRLFAEMQDLCAPAEGDPTPPPPHLYVTDTLADPYADGEVGQGIYREISRSRTAANRVKREQVVTVVIGNPPYKEKAKSRGGWIESGGGVHANRGAPLKAWAPPAAWKVGAHAKHLRNLYVYFWRWATWKVFEQGTGGQYREPPVAENLTGLVCYITAAGFLNGPGFQKMRHDLRRDCDDIWVIDCSPEGHQPPVSTRVFRGVQQPVCIVIASRSPNNDPATPARVRHRALPAGPQDDKFAALAALSLDSLGWADTATGWRDPFLPAAGAAWGDLVPLDHVLGDCGSGVMPGRTWIIAPDKASLERRWHALVNEPDEAKRASLFHPHLRDGKPGDRHIAKEGTALGEKPIKLSSIARAVADLDVLAKKAEAEQALKVQRPTRFGFRSFDRQWIIPDSRVINQPNPGLWQSHSERQVYLTAPMDRTPINGPSLSFTAFVPDLHHYHGRGGRVFALHGNAAGTATNAAPTVLAALTRAYGRVVSGEDLFAYVAALLAGPAYTARFAADLAQPGLRVPLTASEALFTEAAALGREVIRLHTFNQRFSDGAGDPPRADPPCLNTRAISNNPDHFPDELAYDPATRELRVGDALTGGLFSNVPPAVWAYQVSGKNVLRQWLSYRKRNRERPLIGDKRPPSPLGDIQPDHWLPEYTTDLVDLLNVLTLVTALEPAQADLLERILAAPLVPASLFPNPAPRPEKPKAAGNASKPKKREPKAN